MMRLKLKQESREADKLPINQLADYLCVAMPDFMKNKTLFIKQFVGGASNLTYQLSNGEKNIILRRPPIGTKAKSAHDMVREYNVLDKIQARYSLSPKPLLLCEDESILGAKFFIMQEISGLGIDKNLPVEMSESQQHNLCENYIQGLVKLHQMKIQNTELSALGKPQGYVERQLEGWQKRFLKAKTKDVLDSDSIYSWLKVNLALNSGLTALVHNDYKFDNLILNQNNPEEIIGVLDWEMTTLGDPLLDLGCSLAYWVEASDSPEMQAIRMMPTHLSGMMSRQEVFDRYCQLRQLKNINLKPYYIFGLFRLAVIAQQIYFRFYNGQTNNQKFANFGQLVNILIQTAKQQISHF